MAGARKLVVEILGDAKGFGSAVGDAGGKLSSFAASAGKAALGVGVAFAGAAAAAAPLISAASNLAETQSKVGVIFGDAAGDIEKFAATAAKSLGQSKQQAMDASATFATFGKSAGLSGKDLSGFAIEMTGLASDLASFNNTSPEEAIEAIGSALRGEAEPIRKYGVLLDDATLKNKALELGLIKSTKDALTPANKVLAAQAAIMAQTKDAQGDFARTSDGLANKQRILAAQFENVKASIGQALLPIALKLAQFVGDKLMPLFEKLSGGINAFAAAFRAGGNDITSSGFAGSMERIGLVAREVFDWLAEHVPPVLAAIGGFIRTEVVPALQAFGGFIVERVIPALADLAGWVREQLLPAVQEMVASFAENVLPVVEKFVNFVRDQVLPVLAAIGAWLVEHVLPRLGELVKFIVGDVLPAFFQVVNFIGTKVIPVFAEVVAAVAGFVGGVATKLAGWVLDVWTFGGQVIDFFRELPGKIGDAFSALGETLLAPFKWAFREIAKLWNNTVGKISFTTPSWLPLGMGDLGWSFPKAPEFHTGGTFRAASPGGVGWALLRDGETVTTPGNGGGQTIIVELNGQTLLNALVRLDRQNGGTPLRVKAS